MGTRNANSSQAAWALLTGGVASARIEAHRLRQMVSRVLELVEESDAREHLYEVAGDLIQGAPSRIEALERYLDRTSYALSALGEDHLRERLPLSDRKLVDEAVAKARPLAVSRSAARVADRWVSKRADLDPPLGWPGGPCHVIDRARAEVRNPRLREELVDDIEAGEDWTNPEAAQVYDLQVEAPPRGTRYKRLVIGPHTQYRADLRGVTVPQLRAAVGSFFRAYQAERSRGGPLAQRWQRDLEGGQPITWTDRKLHVTVVFATKGEELKVITAYWEGVRDPTPPGEGGCDG
jgi:hypothetical protein